MRKGLIYALVLSFLFVGTFVIFTSTVSAQGLETGKDIPASIVTCSGIGEDGAITCNWCSFVQLIGNLIKYAIFLAVTVSSLMFAYAGFLFLTNNGNPQNVTAAWEIFRRTIYGIIGILAAWLIVNAIMTRVAGNEEWMNLECADVSIGVSGGDFGGGISDGGGARGTWGNSSGDGYIGDVTSSDYDDAIRRLEREQREAQKRRKTEENKRIRTQEDELAIKGDEPNARDPRDRGLTPFFTNNNYCLDNEYGCRYIDGLKERTVKVFEQLDNSCQEYRGLDCGLRITRAAEPNRDEEFEDNDLVYNYRNGYKININAKPSLTQYMTTNLDRMGQTPEGYSVYRDKCGNQWQLITYPNASRTAEVKGEWVGTIKYSVPADSGNSCF